MSIPTAADLAKMRTTQELLQPDTVTITDPGTITVTPDGGTEITGGGSTESQCRLARTGTQANLAEFGEQITAEADYILSLPHDAVIQEGWTVTIAGEVYTVLSVGQVPTWGTAVRAAIVLSTPVGG